MEHPLTVALLLVPGFNLGLLLIRLFGPREATHCRSEPMSMIRSRCFCTLPRPMSVHHFSKQARGQRTRRAVMPQFPVTSHPRSSGFGSDVDRTHRWPSGGPRMKALVYGIAFRRARRLLPRGGRHVFVRLLMKRFPAKSTSDTSARRAK